MSIDPIGSDIALSKRRQTAAGTAVGRTVRKPVKPGQRDWNADAEGADDSTNPNLTNFLIKLKAEADGFLPDTDYTRIKNLLITNGHIDASASVDRVISAYEKFDDYSKELELSLGIAKDAEDLIAETSRTAGTTLPKGPSITESAVNYGLPQVGDRSDAAKQARIRAQEFFKETIGRAGSSSEIEDLRVALVKAAAKAPAVTKVVRKGNRTVTETTPGFDLNSWARGYLANKFATEDVDGILGKAQDQLRNAARQYGIDMGTNWYTEKAALVGKGQSVEDFLDDIRQSAASRYVGVADRINKGETFDSITSPYKRAMSNILEIDENSIDYTDPTIQQAVNMQNEQGQFMTKPIWQFEKDLRKDPRWQKTSNARASYDNIMLKVLKDFGLMG
jgi:hypothetical protein